MEEDGGESPEEAEVFIGEVIADETARSLARHGADQTETIDIPTADQLNILILEVQQLH